MKKQIKRIKELANTLFAKLNLPFFFTLNGRLAKYISVLETRYIYSWDISNDIDWNTDISVECRDIKTGNTFYVPEDACPFNIYNKIPYVVEEN